MKHVIAATLSIIAAATSPNPQTLFETGDFTAAQAAAQTALAQSPRDPQSLLVAGTVAVYENRLAAASEFLRNIPQDDPSQPIVQRLLTEIDRRTKLARHDDISYGPSTDTIPFVATEPIPVVAATVNGHRGLFQLDTGAPGISVDGAFAQEIGLPRAVTSHMGTFANGVTQAIPETKIAAFGIGGATIRNVTATELPLREMNGDAYPDHLRIDGAIGTGVFERFATATIDYAHGSLILSTSDADAAKYNGIAEPLWLVGDHFLVTRGMIAGQAGAVAIDTGLLGAGVVPSEETIRAANLKSGPGTIGQTPGGPAMISSVTVPDIMIGNVTEHDVPGIASPEASGHSPFRFKIVGTVGGQFFRGRMLTIDFAHLNVRISDADPR